jgi:predicted Zn-dependent protease with MMP-like domain/Flp pilus assembly protein TadD
MSRPLFPAVAILLVAAGGCTRKKELPAPPAPSARGPGASASGALRTKAPAVATRPAAICLPPEGSPSSRSLVVEGRSALDDGDRDRALLCADEAVRLAPRLVAALVLRADALGALDRLDDARLAWARALAVDPSDPDALLGAADLHVRRLGPARDALEAGLEYALRGARSPAARRDRTLAARLELVAGMAENDLGRSQRALPHLDRATAVLKEDADAAYERGVALYELSRFPEAEKAFERTLAIAPGDAWALHQLGLVAERRGDRKRAESLLARARTAAPQDFPPEVAIDEEAFRREVRAAIDALPEEERRAIAEVPVEVTDLPAAEDLLAVDPPLSPSILGLFRGPSESEACTDDDGPRCRAIVFYRKNLVRFARDRKELEAQVRVTLLHELGHLHGEDDDQLRARGLE